MFFYITQRTSLLINSSTSLLEVEISTAVFLSSRNGKNKKYRLIRRKKKLHKLELGRTSTCIKPKPKPNVSLTAMSKELTSERLMKNADHI